MVPVFLLFLVFMTAACQQPRNPEYDDLGPTPPGSSPEVFAPGTISSDSREHSSLTFSPDGNEIYFTRQIDAVNHILFMERINGKWSAPRPAPFDSDYLDAGATFSPNGERIYFGSRRPINGSGEGKKNTDIWHVERTAVGWSEPVHLGPPINTDSSEGSPCITRDGEMYFHSDRDTERINAEIYKSRLTGGKFSEPERLGPPINTELYEAAPFVDPERGYMTYFQADLRDTPKMGLRLSFQKEDGTWSEPIDLVERVGLGATDLLMAKGSPDGKYVFILDRGDIYWVDAKVIDTLRP